MVYPVSVTSALPEQFRIPEAMWKRIQPLLPLAPPKPKGGRPRNDDRKMMEAIFYVLRTGVQWKGLPPSIAAGSSAHDRFQEWQRAGVFRALWRQGLLTYDRAKKIQWKWQALDGAMTKVPLGGEATGHNPTDRAKSGTKRSVLTDGRGVPLALSVAGANRHDMKLTEATLAAMPIDRPWPTADHPQNLCLDAAFDCDEVREIIEAYEYVAHIRSRFDEHQSKRRNPRYRARRWVVERTHSWLNRFRRLLIRWEKHTANYLALLELACAYIAFRAAQVFG